MLAVRVVHGACSFVPTFAVASPCARPPFASFEVHGVGAVGSCGMGFSVPVVCGGVLVLPLYPRLRLVCLCLVVVVVTDSHISLPIVSLLFA